MSYNNIIVKSNFPDMLSSNVEYTISFQIITEERIKSTIKYKFSDDSIIKRISKTEENNEFFFLYIELTFILSGLGNYNFSLILNENSIFEKSFILEKILEIYDSEINIHPQCFLSPDNVLIKNKNNTISFFCQQVSNEKWINYYLSNNIKNNKKIYCGLRYYAPDLSTHWKIITKGEYGIQDSGYVEFIHTDENRVDWYFPIAQYYENKFQICEKEYFQSVGFYKLVGNEYVELSYNEYEIQIISEHNFYFWNKELIDLLKFVFSGKTEEDLIKIYCSNHYISYENMKQLITKYKNNFGEFALNRHLIESKSQKNLINYFMNYYVLNDLISSGVDDLRSLKDEVDNFIKKYYVDLI